MNILCLKLEWLLDRGVHVNKVDNYNRVPLSAVVDCEFIDEDAYAVYNTVELLLRRGANVNYLMPGGKTMLHVACEHFIRKRVIQLILEFGAKVNVLDEKNRTPFSYAKHNQSIAELFVKVFASIKFKEEINPQQKVNDLLDLRDINEHHPVLKTFYDDCLKELRSMKSIALHQSISMYEALLVINSNELAALLKKEEFAKLFFSFDVATKFPLYFTPKINNKLEKAKELKCSMDELDEKLYSTLSPLLREVGLPTIFKCLHEYES